MSSNPLVSILMPAYNAEKFLAEAINSILNQDYSHWELLILDDASSDSTAAIANSFQDERIKIFCHTDNQGYLISCNELFDKAKGDFITFLDADDSCSPNRLSSCLRQFALNPELDFLATDCVRISEVGKTISENHATIDYNRYATDPSYYPTICCATTFLKKELLTKVGGYRPFFTEIGGEDYYWIWELSSVGLGMHLSELLYGYRLHKGQISTNHQNDLSLFLPELLAQLRADFHESQWEQTKAEKSRKLIMELYVLSGFQLHLRKGQQSVNRDTNSFWNHVLICFTKIRKPKELSSFLYLLYSYTIRTFRKQKNR